jgi:hypothetical protein
MVYMYMQRDPKRETYRGHHRRKQLFLSYLPFSLGVDRATRISAAWATLLPGSVVTGPDSLLWGPNCTAWFSDSTFAAVAREALLLQNRNDVSYGVSW